MIKFTASETWLFSEPYPTNHLNTSLIEAKIWLTSKGITKPLVLIGFQTKAFTSVVDQIFNVKMEAL